MPQIHLIKLCVGISSIEELQAHRQIQRKEAEERGLRYQPVHITRMTPRRADELLAGGSLYWVIAGKIQARQLLIGLEPVTGEDGIRRCAILMADEIIRTRTRRKRPFQGWRYLKGEDAPKDLLTEDGSDAAPLPRGLRDALDRFGIG